MFLLIYPWDVIGDPLLLIFKKYYFLDCSVQCSFLQRSLCRSVKFIEKTDHYSFGCFLIGFVIAIVPAGFF